LRHESMHKRWLSPGRNRRRVPGRMEQPCVWARARVVSRLHAISHSWQMCTYNRSSDVWISRRIQQHGCFECDGVLRMLGALRSAADATLAQPVRRKRTTDCEIDRTGSGPMIIDVGANIGMYSLAAAAACFEAVAFEPVPQNALRVLISARRNAFDSRRLRLFIVGASDGFGTAAMGESDSNQGAVAHKPTALAIDEASASAAAAAAHIALAPLDAVLPADVLQGARPIFLKMDVEGAECRALRGLRRWLSNGNGTRIVGALIETGQLATRECCSELVSPHGAFHVLRWRHHLCARDLANDDALVPIDETLCTRSVTAREPARRWPWELLFNAC